MIFDRRWALPGRWRASGAAPFIRSHQLYGQHRPKPEPYDRSSSPAKVWSAGHMKSVANVFARTPLDGPTSQERLGRQEAAWPTSKVAARPPPERAKSHDCANMFGTVICSDRVSCRSKPDPPGSTMTKGSGAPKKRSGNQLERHQQSPYWSPKSNQRKRQALKDTGPTQRPCRTCRRGTTVNLSTPSTLASKGKMRTSHKGNNKISVGHGARQARTTT
jgi:hypothetical protein